MRSGGKTARIIARRAAARAPDPACAVPAGAGRSGASGVAIESAQQVAKTPRPRARSPSKGLGQRAGAGRRRRIALLGVQPAQPLQGSPKRAISSTPRGGPPRALQLSYRQVRQHRALPRMGQGDGSGRERGASAPFATTTRGTPPGWFQSRWQVSWLAGLGLPDPSRAVWPSGMLSGSLRRWHSCGAAAGSHRVPFFKTGQAGRPVTIEAQGAADPPPGQGEKRGRGRACRQASPSVQAMALEHVAATTLR